ncbi:MAG: methionine gamma-lyase family protein [Oscillospiraceae bacterium]|jgi:cystathionine beta-lyase family protein involved in aluminum resistance|nr:methionine gamma-lyase family protein [Oscillospiraceae bacterium]
MKLDEIIREAETRAAAEFARIDETALENTRRVMNAFQTSRVSEACFSGTTGYGYDDRGRETLDRVFAEAFGAERALVRSQFANGTHAITAALFACMRPGKTLISAAGAPYDTLRSAIGLSGNHAGSLMYWGAAYREVALTNLGAPDYDAIREAAAAADVAAVFVQRSRGYSMRPALGTDDIAAIARIVHEVNPDAAVVVDNCYGEFVDTREPTMLGADLIAGSLIKNPGGGIAPCGGYVAGRGDLVEAAAARLTSPGIGGEAGATLGVNRSLFQGLFLAPHTVAQALKTAVLAANVFGLMDFEVFPKPGAVRNDIIQSVLLGKAELVREFCAGIQSGAPVDSFVTPEPWDMPGYECPVIMAAGAFVSGASIELSADAPMREPYAAYLQGGLTYESGKLGIMKAAARLMGLNK